jgi:hypothetical protein
MDLHFDYWRVKPGADLLVARGDQQVMVMRKEGERMVPAPVPAGLRDALKSYEIRS